MTAEEFIRNKVFPSGITDENWEVWKFNQVGKNWIGFALEAMEAYANDRMKQEAIEFAEWLEGNYSKYLTGEHTGKWFGIDDLLMSGVDNEKIYTITELYDIFKAGKLNQKNP